MGVTFRISKIIFSGLGLGLVFFPSAWSSSQSDVCLTKNCVQAAAHILDNLHPDYESIDPCENFDQYVCGGYPSRWPMEETISNLKWMNSVNQYVLKSILESPYPNTTHSTQEDEAIFEMVVKNYNSCMDEKAVEGAGLGHFPEIVEQIVTLFPLEDSDYSSNDALAEKDYDAMANTIVYLSKIGIPIFGEFWTVADNQYPDVMVPQFGINLYEYSEHALPSTVTVAELAALSEEKLTQILNMTLPVGAAKNNASKLALGVLDLAIAISKAEAPLLDPKMAPYQYHMTTIAEAVEKAPALVLGKVIAALAPPDYKLDRKVFQFPDMYSNISSILSDTPRSTIQALMIVMAHNSSAPYLAGSTSPEVDRWETCFAYVDTSLPWIASKFFLDSAYSEEKRVFIETTAEELKSAFRERVNNLEWMDDTTKALVREKASEILPKIGSPLDDPNTRNASALLEYYSPVNITESLFGNVLSIRQWAVDRAWRSLSEPVDRTAWPELDVHAYKAGARYGFNYNHIVLPAGIAQAPLYYEGAPSSLMYSTMGMVAGHEITHGFDTNGRIWNDNRQYNQPWWGNESVASFENHTKCFVEQFSSIQAADHNGKPFLNQNNQPVYVNGTTTLAENIADAGGLAIAYTAWQHQEKSNPSQSLPGLENFTKEQLFFLSVGQIWCSKYARDDMLKYIAGDGHAPEFARILGVAQNSRAFREAWQCKEKEPVCELW